MDSKKPGMLRHLRQKMMPHLRRAKPNQSKHVLQLDNTLDHRMSASVPDIRNMRQEYAHLSSVPQLQQYNSPSFSNPSTPLVQSGRGQGEGGGGLLIGVYDGEAGRSVPADCTDWASSHESFNSLCGEEYISRG
ncbi:hypothetical protein KUCAC02_002389 [Chaenocephalus aceratus]|uniref:Uncharacterized protein n=1 Tax=Chaenocephalus aceratus TaxID=36190 RepID=A0ACB9XVM2_CHAAC|nr:hypothetical protein KUCAC02_002389 [Chaenocephalus aceratus]